MLATDPCRDAVRRDNQSKGIDDTIVQWIHLIGRGILVLFD
jgi:hypothetical protein